MPDTEVSEFIAADGLLVLQAQLGSWSNLNHLLICTKTGFAAIVDPFSGQYWFDICEKKNVQLQSVILTHSHWDHTKGVEELINLCPGIKIYIHEQETLRGWNGPDTNRWNHEPHSSQIFELGALNFDIHCTPGHTPGHITLSGHGIVVSGDCMFLGRCGRTDLLGGDMEMMHDSLAYLKGLMKEMDENWVIFPGHQYPLENGANPTILNIKELLEHNSAIRAAGDWNNFKTLEFLSFDDTLSKKAKKEKSDMST